MSKILLLLWISSDFPMFACCPHLIVAVGTASEPFLDPGPRAKEERAAKEGGKLGTHILHLTRTNFLNSGIPSRGPGPSKATPGILSHPYRCLVRRHPSALALHGRPARVLRFWLVQVENEPKESNTIPSYPVLPM